MLYVKGEPFQEQLLCERLGFECPTVPPHMKILSPLPYQREVSRDGAGMGSRVGAVVRALAFHQCVPGLIPGPGVICELSLLLVLALQRGFFSGFSGFPPSTKINTSKFQFYLEAVDEEPPRGNATANSHHYVIIIVIIIIIIIIIIFCLFTEVFKDFFSLKRVCKYIFNHDI